MTEPASCGIPAASGDAAPADNAEQAVVRALRRVDRPVPPSLGYQMAAAVVGISGLRHTVARIARYDGDVWDGELVWTAPTTMCGLLGPVTQFPDSVLVLPLCKVCSTDEAFAQAWDGAPPDLLAEGKS